MKLRHKIRCAVALNNVFWAGVADYYSKQERFRDFFAASTVVDDEKRFVTGQNQNSSHETAQNIMAILDQRVKVP